MNFNLYILGNPNGIYKQVPDDYMSSEIAEFLADLKGTRLVIRRKMNLMHYVYLEKLDANKYIGFCLIFNNAQVTRLKQLISLFRFLIEDYLINKGDIIRYGPSGELEYVIDSFSQNIERYKQISLLITDRLDNQSALYGVSELNTIFNGEHSSRRVGCDLNEEELLRMASFYNTLIVEDTTGMEQGYIPSVMAQLRAQADSLKGEIGDLQQENERLKKQKKQFKWVVTLLLCILVGIIAFVRYAQNKAYIIEGQSGEIDMLNMVITDRNSEIDNLNLSIERLRQDSVRQANALNRQTGQLNTLRANVHYIHDALEQMPTYLYFPAWTSTNYHQPNSKSGTTYAFYAEINNELVFTLEDGSNGTVKLTNFGLGDLSLDIHWTGNHPIDLYWRLDGSGLAPTEGIVSSHKDRYSYRISHFESFHWTASKAYANGVEIHITPQR